MQRRRLAGLALGTAAALIGGSWQVLTRQATTTSMHPYDLALLRYGVPALILAPLWWRSTLRPAGVPRGALALMVLGAGLPFGLLAMAGSRHAPAAHMGVLIAGASPLIAAVLAALLWRERPGPARLAGLALMAAGVLLLAAPAWHAGRATPALDGTAFGDALFLLAATLWAAYTLAFRRTGLTPWQGAALVSAWSALALVPAWWVLGDGARLAAVPWPELAGHALVQGVVAGLLGLWTISAAIERLGASQAAAFGALAPAVSALGGWWWLGDPLSALDLLAVGCAVAGVLLASRAR